MPLGMRWIMGLTFGLLSGLALAQGVPPSALTAALTAALSEELGPALREGLQVSRFSLVSLDLPADTSGPVDLVFELDQGRAALALDPHRLRGATVAGKQRVSITVEPEGPALPGAPITIP